MRVQKKFVQSRSFFFFAVNASTKTLYWRVLQNQVFVFPAKNDSTTHEFLYSCFAPQRTIFLALAFTAEKKYTMYDFFTLIYNTQNTIFLYWHLQWKKVHKIRIFVLTFAAEKKLFALTTEKTMPATSAVPETQTHSMSGA